ncbi:efflux RND transporter periplasmic adaptor subunit [Microtetraspora malaysiensis]|uniref:efflux RND transporter periplasmic adaptor subunit n=1 Tax=Microtetraspora malaysiensis TaxID=161358 RepID=UPI000B176057|nr:efflux RND transporter periplasmic adaptor subunit [Microtetraspora malaysiensis]
MTVRPKVLRTGGLALACAVLACGGVYLLGGGDDAAPTARIELVAARRGDVTSVVSASGNTVDAHSRDLSFGASGVVRKVYVKPGQKVRTGQALARVDATEAKESYLAARAALSAAYEALDNAEKAESSSTDSTTSTPNRTSPQRSTTPSTGPTPSAAASCPPGKSASASPRPSAAAPSASAADPIVVTPVPVVTTAPVPISTTTSRPTPISTTTSKPSPIATTTITSTSEPVRDAVRRSAGGGGSSASRSGDGSARAATSEAESAKTGTSGRSEARRPARGTHPEPTASGVEPTPEPSQAPAPEPTQAPEPVPTVTVTQTVVVTERVTVRETVTITQGIIETIVKMLTVGGNPAGDTSGGILGGGSAAASGDGNASAKPSATAGSAAGCGTGTGKPTSDTGKPTAGRATGSNGSGGDTSNGRGSAKGGSGGASSGGAGGTVGEGRNGGGPSGGATVSVEQAEADVATAKRELSGAKEALAGVTIKAPSRGTVMSVGGKAGDTANAGAAFITLGNLDELQVNALFTESDVGKLKVGQRATVTMDTHPGQEFAGTITHIDITATTANQLVRYGVRVALSSGPKNLLAGQTAYVSVTTGAAENAVYVPARAVETGPGGTATVTVRVGGEDVRRQVRTGVEGDQYVQIVEGLGEGDEVVVPDGTAGAGTFPDGSFPGLSPTPARS